MRDDPDAGAPEWYRRSRLLRRAPIIAVIVIVVIILHASSGTPPPKLTKSCTTPAYALSTYNTPAHRVVQWTLTGKPDTTYEITIGVAGFNVAGDGSLQPQPDPGSTIARSQSATTRITLNGSCVAHGRFGVIVSPGAYSLRMFSITGPKTAPVVTEVTTERTFTVTKT